MDLLCSLSLGYLSPTSFLLFIGGGAEGTGRGGNDASSGEVLVAEVVY